MDELVPIRRRSVRLQFEPTREGSQLLANAYQHLRVSTEEVATRERSEQEDPAQEAHPRVVEVVPR